MTVASHFLEHLPAFSPSAPRAHWGLTMITFITIPRKPRQHGL
jgi:hypothetical protein